MADDYDPEDLYQETDAKTAEKWLEDCEEVADIDKSRGGPGYNDWEKDFLTSLRERFDKAGHLTHPFSGKQLVTLRKLWDRI